MPGACGHDPGTVVGPMQAIRRFLAFAQERQICFFRSGDFKPATAAFARSIAAVRSEAKASAFR
jgi:hypothetical protein